VVPVGEALRVAGTAEFAGFDLSLRTERIRSLTNLVQKILPRAGLDPVTARPWCGLRPMSADGVPVIGHTPFDNLWVNSGHGHLGWTMAAGSGQLLAELLSKETPSLDPKPYSPARFD
jgi:D-amino-acid dehydrogenase